MFDYEETKENAICSFEQQIKQLVKDAFDKGYQCGYHDYRAEPQTERSCSSCAGRDLCRNAFTEVSQYCGAYEPQTDCAWK